MLARHVHHKSTALFLDFLAPCLSRPITSAASTRPSGSKKPSVAPESSGKLLQKVPQLISSSHEPLRRRRKVVPLSTSSRSPRDPAAPLLQHHPPQDSLFNEVLRKMHKRDVELHYPEVSIRRCLAEVRNAVRVHDELRVERAWGQLKHDKLLPFLGPPELETFSKHIVTLLREREPSDWEIWKKTQKDAIVDIALHLAGLRYTDVLKACFLTHARRGDHDSVLWLYDQFLALWKERNDFTKDEEEIEFEDDDFVTSTAIAATPVPSGGSDILFFAILAHVLRDDFQAAIATALQSPFKITPHTTLPLLRRFPFTEEFMLKVKDFLSHAYAAQVVANDHTFFRTINKLTVSSNIRHLETLYGTLVIALGDECPWLTIDPKAVSPDRPVVLSEHKWASFVRAFLLLGRSDVVKDLWDDMIRFGHRPGVHVWTTLIRGMGEWKGPDEGLAMWRAMRNTGMDPDVMAYQAIIIVLLKAKRVNEAAVFFSEFRKSLPILPHNDGTASDHVYNTMISGFLANERSQDARALLEEMKTQGPPPKVDTYNAFMAHYHFFEDSKALSAILKEIAAQGLKGDVVTFSILLSSLLRIIPREEAIRRTVALMRKHDIQPNTITYSAIIHHLSGEQNMDALKAALDLLRTMEESGNPDMSPNAVTYTSILTAINKWPGLDPRLVEDTTMHILRKMADRGIHFSKVTYNILIKSFLAYPEPSGLRRALQQYRDMKKRGVRPTADTWYILLHGLKARGEWMTASGIVDDMVKAGSTIPEWLGTLATEIKKEALQRRRS